MSETKPFSCFDNYLHSNPKVFNGLIIGLFAIQILMFTASLIRNLMKKDGSFHVTLLNLASIAAPASYVIYFYFL